MLTRGECHKTQSHIFPKSSTRYSVLLSNSLKRGKNILAFRGRGLNNEASLNKQTEESPVKLFIKQAHCTKGKLLLNDPPPRGPAFILDPKLNTSQLHSKSMFPSGIRVKSN